MSVSDPILASETSAARLLDMKLSEFLELVVVENLLRDPEIVPGGVRLLTDDLRRIASVEAVESLGGV